MNKLTPFSYTHAFRSALNKVFDNFSTFFYVSLIWTSVFLILGLSFIGLLFYQSIPLMSFIEPLTSSKHETSLFLPFRFFFVMLCYLIVPFMRYQLIDLGFALHRGESISLKKAFPVNLANFFRYYLAILYMLLKVTLGTLLFIVPGYYLLAKNYFVGYTLIEDPSKGFREDMTTSHIITNSVKWRLLLVHYVQSCGMLIVALLVPLSFLMPPLFFLAVFLTAVLTLTDVEIFMQLKKLRLPQTQHLNAI